MLSQPFVQPLEVVQLASTTTPTLVCRAGGLDQLIEAVVSDHGAGIGGGIVLVRVQVVFPTAVIFVSDRDMARGNAFADGFRHPSCRLGGIAASVARCVAAVIRGEREIELSRL